MKKNKNIYWSIYKGLIKNYKPFFLNTFFLLFFASFPANSSEIVKSIEKSMPSVVVVHGTSNNLNIKSVGSGFFIDRNHIVTNYHVIKDHDQIYIKTLYFPRIFTPVQLLGFNKEEDIALLRTGYMYPHYIKLNFDRPVIGTQVAALGNLYGFEFSASIGHVVNTSYTDANFYIDALIRQGNSGSPVINNLGEVVGMVKSLVADESNIPVGISTVINSRTIHKEVNLIKEEQNK
jgi:S1-C subfamily serine protease